MHRLEQRAQGDPFLMDALDGYEDANGGQQANLADLSARLQQRTEKKERRIIPVRFLAVAASVLLILSIGGWLLFKPVSNDPGIAKTLPPELKTPVAIPKVTQPIVSDKANAIAKAAPQYLARSANKLALVSAKGFKPVIVTNAAVSTSDGPAMASGNVKRLTDTVAKDTTPLNEMIVMGYATQKKKDITADKNIKDIKINPQPADQPLIAKVPGVNTSIPLRNENYTRQYMAANNISGQVIGQTDGLPIAGATVKIKGSTTATQTDVNGRFSLAAKNKQAATLQVGYLGYQTTDVIPGKKDSTGVIVLTPSSSQLAEVVVTKTNNADDTNDAVIIAAHPEAGWSAFKRYLQEKAISPDGKKGIVKLSFMISANGKVYDIKTIKNLSTDADQKARELINQGPNWAASSTGNPEKVTIKVHFNK